MSKSRIFLFLMLCFIGGVALRSLVFIGSFYLWFLFGVLTIAVFSFSRNRTALLYAALIAVTIAGALWYGRFVPEHLALERFVGQEAAREGSIVKDPEFKNTTQRLVVSFPEAPSERVLVIAKRYPEFGYGDVVRVSGTLEKPEPFDGFNYSAYLAKDSVYFTVSFANVALVKEGSGFARGLFALKRKFEENINAALSSPQSAFANGVLLGDTSGISKELNDAFIATGMSHITALSGYNITVMLIFTHLLLAQLLLPRTVVFWASVGIVAAFVVMTGASPSVVRAALMGLALLLARHLGREGSVLHILVFAACAMIVVNPRILAFDVGFQLSFLAVLGLAYIAPWLEAKLKRIPEAFKLKESFVATVSAQAAVLPLLLYQFHQVSLIAPLTNVLVLPLMPFVMLFGFAVGALGFVSYHAALAVAYPLWLALSYQLGVIHYFSQFSYAQIAF